MRISALLTVLTIFAAAAVMSLVVANASVKLIEENSEIGVRSALDQKGMDWAEVEADGLQVTLIGIAPTEATRFEALSTAGGVVDAARVIDNMQVAAEATIAPPSFSAEILRNDSGLSAIGLIPASMDKPAILARFREVSGQQEVTDLLEPAAYPVPDGWEEAMRFALASIDELPRAKISVEPGRVSVTAITGSAKAKQSLEANLRDEAGRDLELVLDITAPRPVITPFTLRYKRDAEGPRFDACSADTVEAQTIITQAALAAGTAEPIRCIVGLGVPSPQWASAVTRGMAAIDTLGAGSITFADADVTLIAAEGTEQAIFDTVVGELQTDLPDLFALNAKLPVAKDPDIGPSEFTATLSPEGQVQLRGRVSNAALRELADSYAKARFGSERVYNATRIVDDLPADWATRVLAGIEALSALKNGAMLVTPDSVSVSGKTGNADASTEVAALLAGKLGEGQAFTVDIAYVEELDPILSIPTPDECEAEIRAILEVRKISFEPGSATIDASALGIMDDIAEILKECGNLLLEIQGHTDSQGREEMNQSLSQARAESVLNELRARRVLTGSFVAKGYGEATPIADNGTEEGREANRRIEFHLIRPATVQDTEETTLESAAASGDAPADAETDTPQEEEEAPEE